MVKSLALIISLSSASGPILKRRTNLPWWSNMVVNPVFWITNKSSDKVQPSNIPGAPFHWKRGSLIFSYYGMNSMSKSKSR